VNCVATYTVTQADIDAGTPIENTATATVPGGGPTVNPSDSATVTIDPNPGLLLTKAVDKATANVGDVLNYTATITNNGNETLTVGIEDATQDATFTGHGVWQPVIVACTGANGTVAADPSGGWDVPPGAIATCQLTPYTVTLEDAMTGSVTNMAIAHGLVLGRQASTDDPIATSNTVITTITKPADPPAETASTGGSVQTSTGWVVAVASLLVVLGGLGGWLLWSRRRQRKTAN
jgi:hypothetical protein